MNIDFNTILNTLFQAAVEAHTKPLLETIAAQERRLVDMEEFIAKWNFGGEDKFTEAVTEIVSARIDLAIDVFSETVDNKISEAVDDIDVNDAVEKALDNKDWAAELGDAISEEVDTQLDKIDLEDKMRDILRGATVEISV